MQLHVKHYVPPASSFREGTVSCKEQHVVIVTQYVWVQRTRQGYLNYGQHAGTA